MSSKIINIVVVCMLSLFVADRANAGLIIGDLYSDDTGIQWEYVNSFDLSLGERYKQNNIIQNVETFNGLEAAVKLYGPLAGGAIYALSSNDFDEYSYFNNTINGFVNHKAWYDSFGQNGSVRARAENITTDNAGAAGYNTVGDYSAYIKDRAQAGDFMNHVFKSVTTSVPEPSTIAIFSLALIGLVSRRFKN
tara:strand:- start:1108 stop:1686 length:579 start_codon:yes stop_codon:yes gene_type:complete